ncbi:MAG: hypothetical protein ACI9QL_001154 [Candidatus Omnitrophota bacterium]
MIASLSALGLVSKPQQSLVSVDAEVVIGTIDERVFGMNTGVYDPDIGTAANAAVMNPLQLKSLRFPGGAVSRLYVRFWPGTSASLAETKKASSLISFTGDQIPPAGILRMHFTHDGPLSTCLVHVLGILRVPELLDFGLGRPCGWIRLLCTRFLLKQQRRTGQRGGGDAHEQPHLPRDRNGEWIGDARSQIAEGGRHVTGENHDGPDHALAAREAVSTAGRLDEDTEVTVGDSFAQEKGEDDDQNRRGFPGPERVVAGRVPDDDGDQNKGK